MDDNEGEDNEEYTDTELASLSGSSPPTPTGSSGNNKLLIMSLLEGSKNRRQKAWVLAEPPHVVIGNPLALTRLVEHGRIRYHQVKMVVIDEVDACLISRESRAQLQALLGKYLSPSYLTAELEEEAQAEMTGKGADDEVLLPQGAMKDEGAYAMKGSTALAPWRLAQRQTIFASATIPQHNHFIKQCVQQQWTLNAPVHVQVTPGELMPPQLQHNYLVCPTKDDKLAALRAFLKREASKGKLKACAIFAADDNEAQDIAEGIGEIDMIVPTEDGQEDDEEENSPSDEKVKKTQQQQLQALISRDHIKRRATIMDAFRAGNSRFLVTTDFAARGLDIPRISHVVMYDIPTDAETYLHRGGRAGRMGRAGSVTSLVSETEEFALLRLANSLKIAVKRLGIMKKPAAAIEDDTSSSRGKKKGKKRKDD